MIPPNGKKQSIKDRFDPLHGAHGCEDFGLFSLLKTPNSSVSTVSLIE